MSTEDVHSQCTNVTSNFFVSFILPSFSDIHAQLMHIYRANQMLYCNLEFLHLHSEELCIRVLMSTNLWKLPTRQEKYNT